jgi:cytidine deaminase
MTQDISNAELIALALDVINPKQINGYTVGDVGVALVTDKGNVYRGVCVDAGSGLGFCAERTAISQMITNKEYKIRKIVAVWNNNPTQDVHVLPPCGACRQYMYLLCEDALDIDVVLGHDESVRLAELLPYSGWPEKEELSVRQTDQ